MMIRKSSVVHKNTVSRAVHLLFVYFQDKNIFLNCCSLAQTVTHTGSCQCDVKYCNVWFSELPVLLTIYYNQKHEVPWFGFKLLKNILTVWFKPNFLPKEWCQSNPLYRKLQGFPRRAIGKIWIQHLFSFRIIPPDLFWVQFHAKQIHRRKLWTFWIGGMNSSHLAKYYGLVLKEAGKNQFGQASITGKRLLKGLMIKWKRQVCPTWT